MNYLTLNRVFSGYLTLFVAIVLDILPRSTALVATIFLMLWMIRAPLEDGVLFFIRAVPLFLALPLTTSFDNFNMWRPLALLLILLLVRQRRTQQELATTWKLARAQPSAWLKSHPVTRRLAILLALAVLSLLGALFIKTGIIRIIYFINLSMAPMVLWVLLRRGSLTAEQVIRAIGLSTIIVVAVGYLQLASTYFIDVYQFMRLWGEGIQLRQFGTQWSYIAVNLGNTWLAYYGPQLSLRVFSLFPDSHTFPIYVLLGMPALLALSLDPILAVAQRGLRAMATTRARMAIVWVPLAFLIAILSGTRGIWAASVGVVGLAILGIFLLKHLSVDIARRSLFSYLTLHLAIFFMLFAIAWPIFISPQFLIRKGDLGILGNRVRSILDFGETSNSLRIEIWKSTAGSIRNHPLLGVGIGNFPVVLNQNIALAKAGSTAHNAYLHVASEMGIPAGLEFIILLGSLLGAAWTWFRAASGVGMVYAGASLLFLPWIYAYLLTDAALFDERAFLAYGFAAALIWSHARTNQPTP